MDVSSALFGVVGIGYWCYQVLFTLISYLAGDVLSFYYDIQAAYNALVDSIEENK